MLVELAADAKAGRALLDKEHRHRSGRRARGAGLGGDADQIGVDAIGDVELGAIEPPATRDLLRRRPDRLHVRTGVGFGDRDGGDHVAAYDRRHPAIFLRVAARVEDMDRGHVSVDQRGDRNPRIGRTAQFLGEHDGTERIHFCAAIAFGIANAEEAERAHAAQQFAWHEAVALPGVGVRTDLFGDETAELLAQHRMLFAEPGRGAGCGHRDSSFSIYLTSVSLAAAERQRRHGSTLPITC